LKISVPVCYQWSRDGVDIVGATGPSYPWPVTVADNGARFQVRISIIGSADGSAQAVLTVITDTIQSHLCLGQCLGQPFNIVVRFSEPVKPGAAQDTLSWSVPGFDVVSAVLGADQMTVTLGLSGLMTPAGVYTVTVGGIEDLAGNFINPDPCTLTLRAPVISCGFTLKELYLGLSASTVAISELRSSPKYPGSPDLVRYGDVLELNTFDEFEGYGARLRGWIRPPVTGNYTFYIAADDNGEFWLSTDDSPANIVNIANEPVWSGRRTWTGEAGGGGRIGVASPSGGPQANISGPHPPLMAGQMYYYEARVKEGGGGDNLAVAWQIPGQPVPANGSSPSREDIWPPCRGPLGCLDQHHWSTDRVHDLPSYSGPFNTPPRPSPLARQGTGMTAGNTNVTPFIQWEKSVGGGAFATIIGGTGPTLTVTPTLADNGACYHAVFYVPGATATSGSACLTVNQGNTPPSFTCGTNQNVLENSGATTVPGWAGGVAPDSINAILGGFTAGFEGTPTATTITYASDFATLPPGSEVGGNAAVTGGILHLTDAVNSQQGSWASPTVAGVVNSFTATFKVQVGGGTCCGARTADGWSFNYGLITYRWPSRWRRGIRRWRHPHGRFDSWDNAGTDEAPDIGCQGEWHGDRLPIA
jgi:hypothetical protein